jgi:hypothetical protein
MQDVVALFVVTNRGPQCRELSEDLIWGGHRVQRKGN